MAANWIKLSHASAIESRVGAVEGAIGNGSLADVQGASEHTVEILMDLWSQKNDRLPCLNIATLKAAFLVKHGFLMHLEWKKYRWIPGNNAVIYGSADGQQSL